MKVARFRDFLSYKRSENVLKLVLNVFFFYTKLMVSLFCFLSTFQFQGLRIDEALRLYLEAFRLPGEAPVIQRLLETFTDNWHVRLGVRLGLNRG